MFSSSSIKLHQNFFLRPTLFLHANGRVSYWNTVRRYGFIVEDKSNENLLVEARNLIFENPTEQYRNLKLGQRVTFNVRSFERYTAEKIEGEIMDHIKRFCLAKYFQTEQNKIFEARTSPDKYRQKYLNMTTEIKARAEILLGRRNKPQWQNNNSNNDFDDATHHHQHGEQQRTIKLTSKIPSQYSKMKRCVNVQAEMKSSNKKADETGGDTTENDKKTVLGLPPCFVKIPSSTKPVKDQPVNTNTESSNDDDEKKATTTTTTTVVPKNDNSHQSVATDNNSGTTIESNIIEISNRNHQGKRNYHQEDKKNNNRSNKSPIAIQKRESERKTKRTPYFRSCTKLIGTTNLRGYIQSRPRTHGGFIRFADREYLMYEDIYFPNDEVKGGEVISSVTSSNNDDTDDDESWASVSSSSFSFSSSDASSFLCHEVTFDVVADPKILNHARAVNVRLMSSSQEVIIPEMNHDLKDQSGVVVTFLGHFGFLQPIVENHCGRSIFFHVRDVVQYQNKNRNNNSSNTIKAGMRMLFDFKKDEDGKSRCVNVRRD